VYQNVHSTPSIVEFAPVASAPYFRHVAEAGHRCPRELMREEIGEFMALAFYFRSGSFSPDQYDEAIKQLAAAGAAAPEGRSHHVALVSDGNIQVFDVWESQETFEAFGATLIPILSGLGVDPGEPMVAPVHNVIEG
jgi:hypothetical protein